VGFEPTVALRLLLISSQKTLAIKQPETKEPIDNIHPVIYTQPIKTQKQKRTEKPRWKHSPFQPTATQCLYRRIAQDGNETYFGRIKRARKIYIKKLGDDYATAKKALRKWFNEVETKTLAASNNNNSGKPLTTWGQYKDKYLFDTELDMTLAEKSKSYRNECVKRIIKTWQSVFNEDIETKKIAAITREQCALWAGNIRGFYVGTYNNTVATFKKIFEEAVEAGHLLASPADKLKRIGIIPRVDGCVIGEAGERLG